MMRFAHPEYLYLLALVPVSISLFVVMGILRKRALARFGNLDILGRLAETASKVKRVAKFSLLMLALTVLIIGLANPQIGTRLEEVKQEGVDIFVALDVSLSMKAEDLKPSRLEKARLAIRNLVNRLAGDRIGLIVFAGDAYVQFPLTSDYAAANLFLDVVETDVVPVQGTNIGAAVERAMESFDMEEQTTKVLVVITDGENTEGSAFGAAEDAGKKGVLIYAVGLGSPAGAPIPLYNAAGQQTGFKRDRGGNIVVTKLDEASLERLVALGNGRYYRGSNTQDELDEIYRNINALQKRELGVKQFTDYEDRFQYFLAVAILLLVLEILISERRIGWLAKWNPLRVEKGVRT